MNTVEWCNWSFDECLTPSQKWLVRRDCGDEITLARGDSRNWRAYEQSLQPVSRGMFETGVVPNAKCPNCGKEINGVNPHDNGETWRK